MATCKNCLHSRVCFDSEGTTRYYGTEIAANNVEDLCPCFADRSRYVVREKGEWDTVFYERNTTISTVTHICPKCKYIYRDIRVKGHDFCPNCGADMRKGENG